ncbi:MAG: ABC transporter ATP-binding protein, partial [Actinomycetota bacterium]
MLTVEGLEVRYGEVVAVRDVSIGVGAGKIVAVVGANGAGKTTMLKTISGLLRPAAGRIRFGDMDIGGWSPHRVTRLGIVHVPEGRLLVEEMTVRENLLTGAYARTDRKAILDDLGRIQHRFPILGERAGQKARTLSGGERQMLAIGRA